MIKSILYYLQHMAKRNSEGPPELEAKRFRLPGKSTPVLANKHTSDSRELV